MFALFSIWTSPCGYEDEYIVAVFTSKEKADNILNQIRDFFPQERYYVGEYISPKVDPTLEEIIWEGISNERASDEGKSCL